MTFDELAELLSGWYEVDVTELGISGDQIPADIHPILIDFYGKIGRLAERDTPFKLKNSYEGPLAGQDFIFPILEIKNEGRYAIFGAECQENFRVSASRNFDDMSAYADGDWDPNNRHEGFQNINIPLREFLVTFALKETIASALLFAPKRTEDKLLKIAKSGLKHSGRYVWDDIQYDFFLSKDLWCMKLSDSNRYYFARKNDWKKVTSKRIVGAKSLFGKALNFMK